MLALELIYLSPHFTKLQLRQYPVMVDVSYCGFDGLRFVPLHPPTMGTAQSTVNPPARFG